MSIKIPVEASFNTGNVDQQVQQLEQKLNAIGRQVAQANKTKFEPVSKSTIQDLQQVTTKFEQLLRVSGELNKRIKATGQNGRGFADLDWNVMYPDAGVRARRQANAFQYVTGQTFAQADQAPAKRSGPSWRQVGVGAVQAGLRGTNGITGGAGGVAANSLGTGMSAGFGAGMMGLLGGMLALGVGKLVSAATEKIGQAEDNAVAYDKLKRTLGDVNVSFSGLKASLEGASSNVKVTFDEAVRLSSQFAKLGNVTNEQYGSLHGELRTGVGMSRALGLDPSQGIGFLGTMRGMKQTQDEQGSRRMALLIGETIAKSNAFAKSDEVMEAISNYVTTQTRASSTANVSGYAGMYSSMVGSGIPGMDPSGAASLLSRINGSLSAGGAKGEASQFFTGMVGARRGMDVFGTQLWREGGAFATADSTFGKGTVAGDFYRKHGLAAPTGSETLLDATQSDLTKSYGNNPLMMIQAKANHLGIGMTQAMALDGLKPNQMGELEGMLKKRGLKLGDINMGGLASLSKVVSGTGEERMGVASDLWSRTGKGALSATERASLDKVMKEGSEKEQKEILSELVSSRDQEMTQGKDIRDSKTALENIKTTLADQLLPVTQSMRDGIMWMAGGKDGKSEQTIREDMAKASITEKYQRKIDAEEERRLTAVQGSRGLTGRAYADKEAEGRATIMDASKNIANLKKQRDADIGSAVSDLRKAPDAPYQDVDKSTPSGWRAGTGSGAAALESGAGGGTGLDAKLAAADKANGLPPGTMRALMMQETGGRQAYLDDPAKYHYKLDENGRRIAPQSGKVSTAFGPFGLLESTAKKPGYGVSPLKDKSLDEQIRFASEYLGARSKDAGSLQGGLAGYGEGYGYSRSVMQHIGQGTPMPEDAAAAQRSGSRQMNLRGGFDPLAITIQSPDGKPLAPVQTLQPYFSIPTFGRPS
jgi:hypothetical protein